MLRDIVRFNRLGSAMAAGDELQDGRTVADFLRACGVGKRFVDQYLVPMASAIWSCKPQAILDFPANFMIGFFVNHGLMQLTNRPQWWTIAGGSRNYVEALLEPLANCIRLDCPVRSVTRTRDGVVVASVKGPPERFDQVVFASHANQTLKILADPTGSERQILRAFPYQRNEAVLHTDVHALPDRKRAWASWNYHIPRGAEHRQAGTRAELRSGGPIVPSDPRRAETGTAADATATTTTIRTFLWTMMAAATNEPALWAKTAKSASLLLWIGSPSPGMVRPKW